MNSETFQILAHAREVMVPLRGPIPLGVLKEMGDNKAHTMRQVQIAWREFAAYRLPECPLLTDRDVRLTVWGMIIGRRIDTGYELTYAEATLLIRLMQGNGDMARNFVVFVEELYHALLGRQEEPYDSRE